jgi:hypothetical protein
MNDEEFARQKARIEPLIARWVEPIGLGWWTLTFGYCRGEFEVDGESAPQALACCTANWRYLHAYIEFNMSRVQNVDDDELERGFVHELMHVFLNETRENGKDWLDHEERVATMLSKSFVWLRTSLAPPTVVATTSPAVQEFGS